MIEYRMKVFVLKKDRTWDYVDAVYLGEDEGDAAALLAGEAQVIRSIPSLAHVALIYADPASLDHNQTPFTFWYEQAQMIAQQQGKEFELDTARVAWEKGYTPAGLVSAFAWEVEDDEA